MECKNKQHESVRKKKVQYSDSVILPTLTSGSEVWTWNYARIKKKSKLWK